MFNPKKIKWNKGDPITAADLNAIVARLERLENLDVESPLELTEDITNPSLRINDYALIKRLKLLEDLNRGDFAACNEIFNEIDGDTNDLLIDSETSYTCYDPHNFHVGDSGDHLLAFQRNDSDEYWEVFQVFHKATFIRFTCGHDFSQSSTSVAVDIIDYWDGYSPAKGAAPDSGGDISNSSDDFTVYNPDGIFSGTEGTRGLAQYDNYGRKYWIYQMHC